MVRSSFSVGVYRSVNRLRAPLEKTLPVGRGCNTFFAGFLFPTCFVLLRHRDGRTVRCQSKPIARAMGKKPTPPKLSAEEQEAAVRQKANEALCKAAKDDQRAKAEEALAKGASVDFVNEVRVWHIP